MTVLWPLTCTSKLMWISVFKDIIDYIFNYSKNRTNKLQTEPLLFILFIIFWHHTNYRVFMKYWVFFPRTLKSLPPLTRQHSAAIGCTKNYQQIEVTVHLHSVESFEGLLQRCRRGRSCNELWKITIFPEHPVCICILSSSISQPIKHVFVLECEKKWRLELGENYKK